MTYLIIGIIVVLDQWLKRLIVNNFNLSQSIPVINNIFHLTYVQNKGAAFGILSGHIKLFIIVSLLIIVGLLVYRYFNRESLWCNLAVGLIVGGALGNIIDRINLGYVIDYLDFRIWPVFNLADSAVVVGVGLLIIYLWQFKETDRNR